MKKFFLMKEDVQPLLKLAIPLALTGLVQSSVWFFETLFLAQLGQDTLAAGSLVSWLFGTLIVIAFGVLSSVNILVAYKHGEGDQKNISHVARDGLLLAVVFSLPTAILFWNASEVFILFGQSERIVTLANSYLHALSWGVIANFIGIACLEVIIGVGKTRIVFVFSVVSVLCNVIFSYILIFGKLGFPFLGIAGAGWGLTISSWITTVLLAVYIICNPNYRQYFNHSLCFKKPNFLMELMQIGVPIGFMYCTEVAFFFCLTLLMGIFGSQAQAANQVALQYAGLFMAIIFSIAQAITVRMGHLIGASNIYGAEKAGYLGILIATILTTILAVFIWSFPYVLISVDFNLQDPHNAAIIKEIKTLLMISAGFQIFESIRIAFFGALRGLKDTRFTLFTSILSFWGIALPVGYLLARTFYLASAGFWWGMVFGAVISCLLLQSRYKYKIRRYYKALSLTKINT